MKWKSLAEKGKNLGQDANGGRGVQMQYSYVSWRRGKLKEFMTSGLCSLQEVGRRAEEEGQRFGMAT